MKGNFVFELKPPVYTGFSPIGPGYSIRLIEEDERGSSTPGIIIPIKNGSVDTKQMAKAVLHMIFSIEREIQSRENQLKPPCEACGAQEGEMHKSDCAYVIKRLAIDSALHLIKKHGELKVDPEPETKPVSYCSGCGTLGEDGKHKIGCPLVGKEGQS